MPPQLTKEQLLEEGAVLVQAPIHGGCGQDDHRQAPQPSGLTFEQLPSDPGTLADRHVGQNIKAIALDALKQAAVVLEQHQAMVASEIQAWKEHRASCTTLEQAGVSRSEESAELEKEILQEYEKLQRQGETCFHNIRVKTEGKLLSPHEKQMVTLLDKNRELETRLKETKEQYGILSDELALTTDGLANAKKELARTTGKLTRRRNGELATAREDLKGQAAEIASLPKTKNKCFFIRMMFPRFKPISIVEFVVFAQLLFFMFVFLTCWILACWLLGLVTF